MDNKTIRWLASLLIGIGTGAAITGFATLYLLSDKATGDMVVLGATMFIASFFCLCMSYVVAIQEVDL